MMMMMMKDYKVRDQNQHQDSGLPITRPKVVSPSPRPQQQPELHTPGPLSHFACSELRERAQEEGRVCQNSHLQYMLTMCTPALHLSSIQRATFGPKHFFFNF